MRSKFIGMPLLRDEMEREVGMVALEIDVAFTTRQWRITGRRGRAAGGGFSLAHVCFQVITHSQTEVSRKDGQVS